jgi:hypothetical protein
MSQIPKPGTTSFLGKTVFFDDTNGLASGVSEYSVSNLTTMLRDIADDLAALKTFTNPSTTPLPDPAGNSYTTDERDLINELRSRVSQLINAVAVIHAVVLKTTKET